MSEGVIVSNPAAGVRRPGDVKRTRRLTVSEYAALGQALDAFEAQAGRWQGMAALRLLALTGCRRQEVTGLRWSEVDMAGRALRLTDTKEGGSVRPLGSAARVILAGLPCDPGRPWGLPAPRGSGSFGGLPGVVERVMEEAGLNDVTPHTRRHSFASMAGDLGFSDATIGAKLGHAGSTVTSRYVHHLDAVLVSAADKVSEAIAAAMAAPATIDEFPTSTVTVSGKLTERPVRTHRLLVEAGASPASWINLATGIRGRWSDTSGGRTPSRDTWGADFIVGPSSLRT